MPRARIDALIQAVYDDPIADAPREVLTDALLESGDPRGEFMLLQLRAEREALTIEELRRQQQLASTHCDEWLGPLLGWVSRLCQFRRGFPSLCHLALKDRSFPDLAAWATVEHARGLFGPDALRSFKAVQSMHTLSLDCLLPSDRSCPHLVDIAAFGAYERGAFERMGDLASFPALKKLSIKHGGRDVEDRHPDVADIMGFFQRVERLEAFRTALALARSEYVFEEPVVTLRRDRGAVRLHIELGGAGELTFAEQLEALRPFVGYAEHTTLRVWGYESNEGLAGLKARAPEHRLRALGLRGLEVEYVIREHHQNWEPL